MRPLAACSRRLKWTDYKLDLNKDFRHHEYLDIRRTLLEFGEEDWAIFTFRALSPTDGVSANFHCEDNIFIKDYMVYDKGKNYKIDLSEDEQTLEITSTQWVKPGAGFYIYVRRDFPTTIQAHGA